MDTEKCIDCPQNRLIYVEEAGGYVCEGLVYDGHCPETKES